MVKPSRGKDADEARGMYVFPRDVVRSAIEDETGSYFNPENIRVSGKKDKNKYKEYRDAFHLITELVPNSPPDFKP